MAKNLVLYFSVYGTAKKTAEEIAKQVNGDLVEIEPVIPYDSNRDHYSELAKYAKKEHDEDMKKPYLVITGENAWSRESSTEVFNAVPVENKKMAVIPEAGHFDLYDLAPFVSEAVEQIEDFFAKNV